MIAMILRCSGKCRLRVLSRISPAWYPLRAQLGNFSRETILLSKGNWIAVHSVVVGKFIPCSAGACRTGPNVGDKKALSPPTTVPDPAEGSLREPTSFLGSNRAVDVKSHGILGPPHHLGSTGLLADSMHNG